MDTTLINIGSLQLCLSLAKHGPSCIQMLKWLIEDQTAALEYGLVLRVVVFFAYDVKSFLINYVLFIVIMKCIFGRKSLV